MNKYTKLSDFEINKNVASHYLPCDCNINEYTKTVELIGFLGDTDEYNVYGTFDPCNNPSDAMPIIIDNGIALVPFVISKPVAYDSSKGLILGATAENDNVLRAAMEVFLMMKDVENYIPS